MVSMLIGRAGDRDEGERRESETSESESVSALHGRLLEKGCRRCRF
jgi:hypothetical protein